LDIQNAVQHHAVMTKCVENEIASYYTQIHTHNGDRNRGVTQKRFSRLEQQLSHNFFVVVFVALPQVVQSVEIVVQFV